MFGQFKIPDGTPSFQTGYKDGCSSSTYARSNVFYRTFYKHKYDPKMIGNPEYRFGYSRGYTWCFQYSLSGAGANQSWDRYILPAGNNNDLKSISIGEMWGDFFTNSNAPYGNNISTGIEGMFTGGNIGNAMGDPLWGTSNVGTFFGY